MIRWMALFSRLGKVRLRQFYVSMPIAKQTKTISDATALVLKRTPSQAAFVDFKDSKLIYRRYASLYVCFCMERDDNEILALECIHRYVQALDQSFGSVTELDIIFGFQTAYAILNEMIMAGNMIEPSLIQLRKSKFQVKMLYVDGCHNERRAVKRNFGHYLIKTSSFWP